jgi:signal transduction histidine kinase/CheY-like chemotaxis protein
MAEELNRPRTLEKALHAEVEDRFGVVPNFFRLSADAPEITANLWGFAKFGYLDNPLPSLFKERLFVYLSRFCEVRYCIARHVGFLVGLGRPSGDRHCPPQTVEQVLQLIRRSLPRGDDLEPYVALLETLATSAAPIPEPDTPTEVAVLVCATHVFLQTSQAARCLEALQRTFGGTTFQHLLVFLAFVRTAHFWTEMHPELKIERDITELLVIHEALAACVQNQPEAATSETTKRLQEELAPLRREREAVILRERSEQLKRLAEAATSINSATDISSVLGIVTDEGRNLIACDLSVTTLTAGHQPGQVAGRTSMSGDYARWKDYEFKVDEAGVNAEVIRSNRPVRMTQAELEGHSGWARSGQRADDHPFMRGYLAAPLVGRDGRNIGLIQLSAKHEGEFTEDDESVLVQLAQMGSVAIENARLYEQLRDADRRKDEFLALLAHELRNPLAPIRNAVQIIRLSTEQAALEHARILIERQLGHMVRLVDDLMDVSRISRNKLELRKERVVLSSVLHSAVETIRPLIEQMGHDLTVRLPPQPVVLEADPARLAQVFINLLNNSAKYTERGGHIRLTVEQQGGDVVVAVKDTGIGIPADKLPTVFDLFSQVEGALSHSQGGLGIGLSLVKRLVEMHDGSVEAESSGPGEGSTFSVRLPVLIAHSQSDGTDEHEEIAPTSNLRILIVDDNRDSAESLVTMLRIMGNETQTAYDGEEAVAAAMAFRPDVILLDIGLPKLNGYEACRRIREHLWGEDVVLIALTGWGHDDDVRRSDEAGFDHHMVKPVNPNTLMKLLAGLKSARV